MVSSDNAYSTLINSAWATHATVIPEQHGQPPIVYVSTVEANFALNRENGKELWELHTWISLFGSIDYNGRYVQSLWQF